MAKRKQTEMVKLNFKNITHALLNLTLLIGIGWYAGTKLHEDFENWWMRQHLGGGSVSTLSEPLKKIAAESAAKEQVDVDVVSEQGEPAVAKPVFKEDRISALIARDPCSKPGVICIHPDRALWEKQRRERAEQDRLQQEAIVANRNIGEKIWFGLGDLIPQ